MFQIEESIHFTQSCFDLLCIFDLLWSILQMLDNQPSCAIRKQDACSSSCTQSCGRRCARCGCACFCGGGARCIACVGRLLDTCWDHVQRNWLHKQEFPSYRTWFSDAQHMLHGRLMHLSCQHYWILSYHTTTPPLWILCHVIPPSLLVLEQWGSQKNPRWQQRMTLASGCKRHI